jgi:biopolymer transport protein ExbD
MSISREKKKSRREKATEGTAGMMLTSLMDIFIVLVLYLLVNQGDGISLEPPDRVVLPDSGVDTAPRQSIVITLSDRDVQIQGESVISMAEVKASNQAEIEPIRLAILRIKAEAEKKKNQSGIDTEVTILADRSIPFKVLKKIMLSSSNAGYGKISFAVNQK